MARIVASSRAYCPDRGARPTGCVRPTAVNPCTVIIRSGQIRHVLNPNIPPSYDQAITGKDKSIKLEEGMAIVPSAVAMETVVSDDRPPAYASLSQSTSQFPLASPTPPPSYSSHTSTHVSSEARKLDDDTLLT